VIVLDMEQGSPEWFEARRGIPTASEFPKIITAKTGKLSTQCIDYISKLIVEVVEPDNDDDSFSNAWMDRGKFLEDEARDWYAFQNDIPVKEVGIILNDAKTAGVSPDGMVETVTEMTGLLEIKCPKASTHVRYLLDGTLPDIYRQQVHGALEISQLDFVDFVSYHPNYAPLVVRVKPDDYTLKVGAALEEFLEKYETAKAKIIGVDNAET